MTHDRLAWFREAKFGLFVHWGAYSVAGVEASWPIMAPELASLLFGKHRSISESEYVTLPQRFNPAEYDPRAWVRLVQQAGMRYIVLTAKHHDGFCMFDAPGTEYKITRTPFGRDICAGLAQACTEAGLRYGFYYSPPDMHDPGYRDTRQPATRNWYGEPRRAEWAGYLGYMESHLRKLLTGYGEVSVLWFDGLINHSKYDPDRFHRLIGDLSPATLVNDRLGAPFDFITPEQFIPRKGIPTRTAAPPLALPEGAFRALIALLKVPGARTLIRNLLSKYSDDGGLTPRIPLSPYPAPDEFQPWETCMTMNRSWAYNPSDGAWKPARQLIRNLVEVVSRGGNYLLNVGPTPRGAFPPEAEERLRAIGAWMAMNGEAVYGTTYGPLQDLPFGRTTAKAGAVYLHVFDWPDGGRISIPAFRGRVSAVTLLATQEPLPFDRQGDGLFIQGPPQAPDPAVTVLAIRTGECGPSPA